MNQSHQIEDSGEVGRNNISYTGRATHHLTIYGLTTRTYMRQKFYKNTSQTLPRLDEQMYKRPPCQTNNLHHTPPNNPLNQTIMSQASSQTSSCSVSLTLFKQLQADYPWPSLQYPERMPTPQLARRSQPMPINNARNCKNWQMASTHAAMVAQFVAILHWPLEHVLQQFSQWAPIMETAWLLVTRGPSSCTNCHRRDFRLEKLSR